MIKIGPPYANEYKKVANLLALDDETLQNTFKKTSLVQQSLVFWQHWLPCQMHLASSVYVAREDKEVLGTIALHHTNKARTAWQIDKLVVHPDHRGRGIAQELLHYVFAQFGSQGVSHFIAEVETLNEAALALFAGCGFCRSSLLTHYRFNPDNLKTAEEKQGQFSLALPNLSQSLCQLYCEVLPPTLRQAFFLQKEDFPAREQLPFTSVELSRQKFMRKRVWYWVSSEPDRHILTACVKIVAEPASGYRLEFMVHPGWQHLALPLVQFVLSELSQNYPRLPIRTKVYDFQKEVHEALSTCHFERQGEAFLLLHEHWVRARRPRQVPSLTPLSNPAINTI